MVLLQGGVTLFQGEFSTSTGWLDKPLARPHAKQHLYINIAIPSVRLSRFGIVSKKL